MAVQVFFQFAVLIVLKKKIYVYTADDYMNIILEEIKDFIEV